MDQDATWYRGKLQQPRPHCVRWGPSSILKGAQQPSQFSAHVYCGQTAGWNKMPLGTEVGLGPGDIVLEWRPSSPPRKATQQPPLFGACLFWRNGRPSQQLLSCYLKFLHAIWAVIRSSVKFRATASADCYATFYSATRDISATDG